MLAIRNVVVSNVTMPLNCCFSIILDAYSGWGLKLRNDSSRDIDRNHSDVEVLPRALF